MAAADRTPILAGSPTTLRALGYDERWLQDWLAADPKRLGLGDVAIIDQEARSGGGLLDLLALDRDSDTYYSVEVQLGQVDASHSFRVFDYWARNRARLPGKTHVAVLMAEDTGGRYRLALEALAESVPLIVIELRCWQGSGEALLVPEITLANENLDLADTPAAAAVAGEGRTEEDWRAAVSEEMWVFVAAFVAWAAEHLGEPRIDFKPQSYIGVRYGRRVWAPLWPRKDGAYVYLPDPDGSRDQPSLAFTHFEPRLADAGLSASWAPKYNAGANIIGVRLTRQDLTKPIVEELLRASHAALADSATAWSERTMSTPASAETPSPGGGLPA